MNSRIQSVVQTRDNLVEIKLADGSDYISCQVTVQTEDGVWSNASLYPELDAEYVLNGCCFLWNQAQTAGTVRLYGRKSPVVYWNPYLDTGMRTGAVELKIVLLTESETIEERVTVQLENTGVRYFDSWDVYLGENGSEGPQHGQGKWKVAKDGAKRTVSMGSREFLPPIRVPLDLAGEYDIYFGFPHGGGRFLAKTGDEPFARFMTPGNSMDLTVNDFLGKLNKEIFWKRQTINSRHAYLELAQLQETVADHYEFGCLAYIKLVPCSEESGSAGSPDTKRPKELVLFYEPYSYSLHGFHDAETMNGVMLEEFMALKPTEITCQTVRIGMKSLHHSKHIGRIDKPARTDENTVIDDPVKLVASCDILRESVRGVQGRNVRLTANIGMNRPYVWLPEISDRFVSDNPHLLENGYFDYEREEVREYAMRIIAELIGEYDIDGLVFDYMRSDANQTAETLVEIISRTKRLLQDKETRAGRKLELKARIPADQIVYYEAMKLCAANGYIDGIIPSNLVASEPLPPVEHYVRLCRGSEVKVYGCIDGWRMSLGGEARAGNLQISHSPQNIAEYLEHYDRLGVDGIFVYQADQVTGNPYLTRRFDRLQG